MIVPKSDSRVCENDQAIKLPPNSVKGIYLGCRWDWGEAKNVIDLKRDVANATSMPIFRMSSSYEKPYVLTPVDFYS